MSQAARILNRFGGPYQLRETLKAMVEAGVPGARVPAISTIYRWMQTRHGMVPPDQVELVQRAARFMGILLTDRDWSPGPDEPETETV